MNVTIAITEATCIGDTIVDMTVSEVSDSKRNCLRVDSNYHDTVLFSIEHGKIILEFIDEEGTEQKHTLADLHINPEPTNRDYEAKYQSAAGYKD